MHRVTREEYALDSLHRIVNGVTFFKDLIKTDASQFELLMSVTELLTAEQNELVCHRGEDANNLYFLLKGQLAVLNDDVNGDMINEINAGEMFGVMAMILNDRRSASVQVNSRQALLARVSYEYFSDIDDMTLFSQSTKISFFRMLCNNLRWTLERNKIALPDHPLVGELRKIPLYIGEKDTREELHALFNQARSMALLLCEWNDLNANHEGEWLAL